MDWPLKPAAVQDIKLPVWTPGYYQLMPYSKGIQRLSITDKSGQPLEWQSTGENSWRVATKGEKQLRIRYEYKTERSFVATSYIDANRGFIRPTSLFLYSDNYLNLPVKIKLDLQPGWNKVATGLDSIAPQTYVANSMDQVYDSPILMGKLNELPSFIIQGKRHRFIGYEMGNFDGAQLMKQVEKIILATGQLMGEYPYNHYTFIGIGPGNGGIEQLNSTAISFTGDEFSKGGKRTLSFLAHEYFHHYNVKRIRPIELGPLEAELKAACEKIAGKNLDELFSLIYTTKPIDYASY